MNVQCVILLTALSICVSLHRAINSVIAGAGAALTGFIYSNITCFDGEVLLKRNDAKFRSLVTMKCFVCGKWVADKTPQP